MERVYTKKYGDRFLLHPGDVWCAVFALLLGGMSGPYEPVFIFLFLAHAYLRTTREALITVFFFLLCMLARSVEDMYFYALGCAFFFVLVYLARLWNRNLYEWMPVICTLSAAPYALQLHFAHRMLLLPLLMYALVKEMIREFSWIHKVFLLSDVVYSALLLSLALLFGQTLPAIDYALLLSALAVCAFVCSKELVFLYVISLLFFMEIAQPQWLFVSLLLAMYRHRKDVCLLLLGTFALLFAEDLLQLAYLGSCALLVLFLKKEQLPLLCAGKQEAEVIKQTRLPQDHLLRRQLHNYASIFLSLKHYYASLNAPQAQLLDNMAMSLQKQAEELQSCLDGGIKKERILQSLEGYQYEVEALEMEERGDGVLYISLIVSNLQKKEIKTTLKPLLEALLQRKLEIQSMEERRFARGYHLLLQDEIPFTIETDGNSIRNSKTTSGDTFSIFRFRQSLVCMISDGMGNGEKAAQVSKLITSIFQKMMVSGIDQDHAIRCINSLVQSDTYATLDVICFHRGKGVAYLSKSAACPTYLLREHKVYELNGSALPVGIVAQMQPDCFEIELQDGDEFIMVSDGVEAQEVYEWMKERKERSMQEDTEIFSKILRRKARKDDSTLILARVKRNKKVEREAVFMS